MLRENLVINVKVSTSTFGKAETEISRRSKPSIPRYNSRVETVVLGFFQSGRLFPTFWDEQNIEEEFHTYVDTYCWGKKRIKEETQKYVRESLRLLEIQQIRESEFLS